MKVGDLVIFEGNFKDAGIVLEVDMPTFTARVYFRDEYSCVGSWFFIASLRIVQEC